MKSHLQKRSLPNSQVNLCGLDLFLGRKLFSKRQMLETKDRHYNNTSAYRFSMVFPAQGPVAVADAVTPIQYGGVPIVAVTAMMAET